MREWRRIFLSRAWLGAAAMLLVCTVGVYIQVQADGLPCSVSAYAAYTRQWEETLSGLSVEEGLAALEAEDTERMGWSMARFVIQQEENGAAGDEELLAHLREQYPGFDEKLQAVREGTAPENDVAALTAVERWIQRLTYLSGYAGYIETVSEQAGLIAGSPLYDETSFTVRNAAKTEADFLATAGVALEAASDDVLLSLVEDQTGLVFGLCLMAVAVVLILEPRRLGLEAVERSCANGRTRLAGWRIGAVALAAAAATLLVRGGQLLTGMLLYRQPLRLGLAVQYSSFFQSWGAPDTVGGFLVWYFLFSAAGLCLAGLLFWAALSRLHSLPLGLVLCCGVLLLEYRWFQSYGINDAYYPLAGYNIFHLLSPGEIAGRYLNYDLFGLPVRERVVLALVIAGLIGAFAAVQLLSAHFARGRRRGGALSRMCQRLAQRLRGLRRPKPVWAYEGRKLLVYSGGLLFLAVAVLFLWTLRTPSAVQSQEEALLTGYVQQYAGPLEEATLAEIAGAGDQADQDYAGALSGGTDSATLAYYAARCWALEALEERYETLLSMRAAGAEGLALVDELPLERVYGETGADLRLQGACAALLALCLILPGAFSLESRHKTRLSLLSTPGGRDRLWRGKALLSLGVTALIWLAWSLRETLLFFQIGGSWALYQVSAASLFYWDEGLGGLPLGGYLAAFYGLRLLGLLAASCLALWISARLPALLPAAGVGAMALLLPALLTRLGVPALKNVSWALWLAADGMRPGWMELACLAVWAVLGASALAASRHQWRRYLA